MKTQGSTLLEKIKFFFCRYSFKEIETFSEAAVELTENVIFKGKHVGVIKVHTPYRFIHKGTIDGTLIVSEKSKAIIFGKIKGAIISSSVICLRKGCEVEGELITKKISIAPGAKININTEK
ncbi:polymer-forming cytoskeletal protein [Aquimarina sp. TRL1]|uniref:polymer-forming cytoskeletal protein n=1 Tax=Aquimarina sp. (strain TRL1) TaxID=2736252 RepID=UPI00158EF7AD|nr:polymer-forming cytoskeletal protein [Aquimarina sp. TRL1]QKX07409.1 polymer-forming cytoskeletal protein [Aquimarina sp. TRL1]